MDGKTLGAMIKAFAKVLQGYEQKFNAMQEKIEYLTNASNRHECVIGEINRDIDELGECQNNLADIVLEDCDCDEDCEDCPCDCHL